MLMLSCEPSTLRVMVVDDHDLTRLTLQIALECQKNIQVVGFASNGRDALQLVQREKPDVVILDLQMPLMDGWTASRQIKAIAHSTKIIVYSSQEENKLSPDQRVQGEWDAFCSKDIPTLDLIKLVRELGNQSKAE
ncbi:response regulator [Calothrix sp. NIES-3974]|uniref:response regulator n=1 Tax=Calothrix sp. NIES-3974 TaxID=2005462 RepID=UPI000B60B524|nr:response regulator transcription factor [Calothrix sp. NIES-3974]BAZ03504.1 two-component response regulator [Calothrix sp. NIES-3974]